MRGKRYAFVVRVWTEDDLVDVPPETSPALRGSIQSADGKEIHYFKTLSQALQLLEEMVDFAQ